MSPKQRVIFSQMQIAGCGLLIFVFGLVWKRMELMIFGVCIAVYGIIRMIWLSRFVSDEAADGPEQSLDQIIEASKEKEKREKKSSGYDDSDNPDDDEKSSWLW